jgi:hypothetical protein
MFDTFKPTRFREEKCHLHTTVCVKFRMVLSCLRTFCNYPRTVFNVHKTSSKSYDDCLTKYWQAKEIRVTTNKAVQFTPQESAVITRQELYLHRDSVTGSGLCIQNHFLQCDDRTIQSTVVTLLVAVHSCTHIPVYNTSHACLRWFYPCQMYPTYLT